MAFGACFLLDTDNFLTALGMYLLFSFSLNETSKAVHFKHVHVKFTH
jgi:hypothetical protein